MDMGLKIVLAFIKLILILCAMFAVCFVAFVGAEPTTIEVPNDYRTIQEAINAANVGDTILVHAGIYTENLTINKSSLKLIGDGKDTTVIDANGTGYGALVKANYVYISGFTVQNGLYYDGVYLYRAFGCVIEKNAFKGNLIGIYVYVSRSNFILNNVVTHNQYGIRMYYSSGNIIANNTISLNRFYGINPHEGSTENRIYGNTLSQNEYGVYMGDNDPNNVIYHNNFINNTFQAFSQSNKTNIWDDGYPSGGNYWNDYADGDLYFGPYQNVTGSDGIIDAPYVINTNNRDKYPLMSPFEYWNSPIPGDINRDTKVDIEDLFALAVSYGSAYSKPNWNANADLDRDGKVGCNDLFILAGNFGKKWVYS